ncbi:outer membrane protein [Bartonella grahamii]|uniref:outer membrane protein n=1 Tax=Bartonella grahamii TaxID=33045 RepID=UPI002E7ACA9A|nr:outer membrane beta-barrel protein [Bartonella grahamii]
MNTKRLITASIFSLISASTALAADVMIPHQPASSTSSTIVAPTFSWTGLYLGVQAGGFSSKADLALVDQKKSFPLDKEFSPKLSGFVGGFYAGSNIDLGDNFIFGVDTDLMISGKKHTKTIPIGAVDNTTVENAVVRSRRSANPQASTNQATGTQARAAQAATGTGGGTTAVASASAETVTTRSNQAQTGQERPAQQSNAGARQSSQSATARSSGNVNTTARTTVTGGAKTPGGSALPSAGSAVSSTPSGTEGRSVQSSSVSLARSDARLPAVVVGGNGSNPASPKPASSSAGAGAAGQSASLVLGRSDEGDQSSGGGTNGADASVKSAATASTSQPSAADRTVPSGGRLVLARSGSSNGTSGAHHSASHSGGHGSGAHSHASRPHGAQSTQAADKGDSSVYGIEQMKRMASELGLDQEDEVETLSHTFKQNWSGATRVRIGFAVDRFMPYLAGGIAYGQFHDTISISVKDEDGSVVSSKNLADETKTMIGYTLGGGVDFSLLDNVIVRAEYRYSDFGKKKFAKEKLEISYKTNDFRVGVAYKF